MKTYKNMINRIVPMLTLALALAQAFPAAVFANGTCPALSPKDASTLAQARENLEEQGAVFLGSNRVVLPLDGRTVGLQLSMTAFGESIQQTLSLYDAEFSTLNGKETFTIDPTDDAKEILRKFEAATESLKAKVLGQNKSGFTRFFASSLASILDRLIPSAHAGNGYLTTASTILWISMLVNCASGNLAPNLLPTLALFFIMLAQASDHPASKQ